ncbi:phage tail protein [Virgisporangium ochraceum]|nr:tail fiber protein [Virgisporangium ochraceum]
MSDPYIGEIRMVGFSRVPDGWARCDGQLLPISGNEALFSVLGTIYGGDGQSTFGLPDLRGRRPVHAGPSFVAGQAGGTETHTLTATELPAHTHQVRAAASGAVTGPANAVWAPAPRGFGSTAGAVLASGCVSTAGGGQPHDNLPPFLVVSFLIALVGIYPSRS